MSSLLGKIAKRLFVAFGCVVILLALAVGAFRLLFTQLPSYQSELSAWVAEELGLALSFDHLDARWGLSGPELTFHDASVRSPGAEEPILLARRALVSIDPWRLMTELEPAVDRLTLDGTRVTVRRASDGRIEIQGAPLEAGARLELGLGLPDELEVLVRDSELIYVDVGSGAAWRFADVTLSLDRAHGRLAVEARAVPPAEVGSRVEVALEGRPEDGGAGDWRIYGDVRAADVAVLARMLGYEAPLEGTGDISIWLDWARGRIGRATAAASLDDLVLPAGASDAARYERVELTAEWMERRRGEWILALNDVHVRRGGREWRQGGNSTLRLIRDGEGLRSLEIASDFLRLEDLTPVAETLPDSPLLARWRELAPRGDVSALEGALAREDGGWDYRLAGRFDDFEVEASRSWPGVRGLSGEVRTDTRSGRVALDTPELALDWPAVFREPVRIEALSGVAVWRRGRGLVRVVSDDLAFEVLDGAARSDLELTLPLGGGSPRLDLQARLSQADLVAAKPLLPAGVLPPAVLAWLDRSVQGGRARDVELDFFGALSDFPFDGGGGQFRVRGEVEDARLEFIEGWPAAEALSGRIEFRNAGFAARGRGRVLGNASEDVEIGIADMRDPVLSIEARTEGRLADVLAFLNQAPLLSRHLGSAYADLRAHAGDAGVALDLDLPLLDRAAYRLDATLAIAGGELSVPGFGPRASEISGRIELRNSGVTAEGIEALFLDGPVSASVSMPERPGYRARLDVEGETTADAVERAFGLPLGAATAGQSRWRGSLLIPSSTAEPAPPVRIDVSSNLTGIASRLPQPLRKAPAEPSNLRLSFLVPDARHVEVRGNLGATRRFALLYADEGAGFAFSRGAVQLGGEQPRIPAEPGLVIAGSLPRLDFGEWLALASGSQFSPGASPLVAADLELAEFFAFGQELGTSRLAVRRDADDWRIDVDSEAIAGRIVVPRRLARRPQIVADMERLYLSGGSGGGAPAADPRELPGLSLRAAEFAVGARRLGRVEAEVHADPLGLRLTSFESTGPALAVTGSGSWLAGRDGPASRVAVAVRSNDVTAALEQLGFDPVMEGELAEVTANLHWPGPPAPGWMARVGGELALRIETGSLVDIEPGAGRVVGLMSIAALPRRLELDFRDVFTKGLVFDEISGDFVIVEGDAYTDNLKLTGPGAEIGVVGRTGLHARDYEQQAIVTAEPGNVLPTVGGLLGGPGVGAALLIFTRIFKEPLKGIGQASYCVKGAWDAPVVERMTPEQLQQNEICAALPPESVASRGEPAGRGR